MTTTCDLAGHAVGRLGYGAMQLPGPGVCGPPRDHDEAVKVLRRVIDLGINHIDTSQFYGPDVANQLIRESLAPHADDLVIVSKAGAERGDDGTWLPAQQPEQLEADMRANLTTLGVARLPVVNLRVMPIEEIGEENACPLEDQLAAMRDLVEEGAIDAFGVSNVTADQACQGTDAGAVYVQNAYNLLHRDDVPMLDLCRERSVAYVPFFPLGSAFPNMPTVTENETVRCVTEGRGITPAQVGLAWLLMRADNILLIPGTSSVAHLEENTAARSIALGESDLEQLDALG